MSAGRDGAGAGAKRAAIYDTSTCVRASLGFDDRGAKRSYERLVLVDDRSAMDLDTNGLITFKVELKTEMGCHRYDLVGRVHAKHVLHAFDRKGSMLRHVRLCHRFDGADAHRAERVLCKTGHEVVDVGLTQLGKEFGEEIECSFRVSWLTSLLQVVGALRELAQVESSLHERGAEDVTG